MRISAERGARTGLAIAALTSLLVAGPGAANDEPFVVGGMRYERQPVAEWNLPAALQELSGFATDNRGRLFAHGDELAVIHELDYAAGRIAKSFAFGDPVVQGDFEGITLVDGRFCLTDSHGVLYLGQEGADGERVAYERIATGIGARCEVEGVTYAADEQLLYFACKIPRTPTLEGRITVVAWSIAKRAEVAERTVSVALDRFADLPGKGPLRPSDVAIAPNGGDLVLSTAGRRALITLARDGSHASAIRLPKSKHMPQIEALAFGSDGSLLVGSEGKERGRMRVYRTAD